MSMTESKLEAALVAHKSATGSLTERSELAIADGDLSKLDPVERTNYYRAVCDSLGINPLTRPFGYVVLNGKLTLYALKNCTDQLRAVRKINLVSMKTTTEGGILTVETTMEDATGRYDTDVGCVFIEMLKGENLANAKMKAVTKAKRRTTLSLCGLGMMDEMEIESIANARKVDSDWQVNSRPAIAFNVPQPPSSEYLVSQKQLAAIHAIAGELGDLLPADWREETKAKYGVASAKDLTMSQADEVIDWLNGLKK